MIKVVIFDLDGLLINSQLLQHKAYNQVFSKYGYPITKKEWEDEWIQNSICCKDWIKKNNLPLNFEKLRAEKKEIYEKLILTDMELKPGANNAIDALSKEYQLCIASGSVKSSIDVNSKKFDFDSRFKLIVADEEAHIKNPKPHPDVFQYVAKKMKVEPNECAVIEDSKAGLKAAKSAKMKCIICPDTFCDIQLSEFDDADKIVKTLNEIDVRMINELGVN